MTSKSKGKNITGKSKGVTQITQSKRAGLCFPVGRIQRFMRKGLYAKNLGKTAPVYLAAVLEYLTAELLELSGNACKENNKKTISPRHVMLAIKNDDELSKFLDDVTIARAGVLPNIHTKLLPKKNKKKKIELSQEV